MRRALHGALVGTLGASLLFCAKRPAEVPPATVAAPAVFGDAALAARETDAGAPAPLDPIDADDLGRWAPIDALVQAAIGEAKMPGCVIVVGRHDEILLQRAYGDRSLVPDRSPMRTDTVFDLASLTKPIATATSIMILADRGKVDIDARASTYVPELAKLPPFTVRQLLIHTSGLPAVTAATHWTPDRTELMRHVGGLTLKALPGERFLYSDVGFTVLQE